MPAIPMLMVREESQKDWFSLLNKGHRDYIVHRELATGKGYADLVLIPRRNVNKPAIVLELKFKKDVDAAIDQIKRKEYVNKIEQYTGDILLVGINYDKKEKKHTCVIETVTK